MSRFCEKLVTDQLKYWHTTDPMMYWHTDRQFHMTDPFQQQQFATTGCFMHWFWFKMDLQCYIYTQNDKSKYKMISWLVAVHLDFRVRNIYFKFRAEILHCFPINLIALALQCNYFLRHFNANLFICLHIELAYHVCSVKM